MAKENVAPAANGNDAPAGQNGKSKAAKKAAAALGADASNSALSKFRPKPRFVFYGVFLTICVGIVALHDPCVVKNKKKDCGYSGITPLACKTTACFLSGGGEMDKKKITLKRQKGEKFGLVSGSKKGSASVFVQSLKQGAVEDHNAKADPEDRIYPRDTIVSVDGRTGDGLRKSLGAASKKDGETVIIEISRSRLPSYLRWIHGDTKPNIVEKVLTSPSTLKWFNSFSKLAGLGFSCWFFSGYPVASLPLYYGGVSAATAFYLSRCCHDEQVAPGIPHCYKGGTANLTVALTRIQKKVLDQFAKVQKSPRSYAKWLFEMPTSLKAWL